MNLNQGKRNKQAVQVLNKVEYDSEGNPIGMMEDPSNPASANFGTPREPRRGGCYKGNGNRTGYVDFGLLTSLNVSNFSVSFYTIIKEGFTGVFCHGNIYRKEGWGIRIRKTTQLTFQVITNYYETLNIRGLEYDTLYKFTVSYINGRWYGYKDDILVTSGIQLYTPGVSGTTYLGRWKESNYIADFNSYIWGFRFDELDSNGNYVQTLAKYNCSENSGNICYDSSGNGNHGTIINAITTTPEENPNSIHQYQDEWSFENEEGYTGKDVDYVIINPHYGILEYQGDKTYKLTSTVSSGNANIFWFRPKNNNQGVQRYVECELFLPIEFEFTIYFRAGIIVNNIITTKGQWVKYISPLSTGESPTDRYSFRCSGITEGEYYFIRNVKLINHTNIIPKNSSITLPPFKDVLGNNLQYIGKVPGKVKFVNSSCFKGNGSASLKIHDTIPTAFRLQNFIVRFKIRNSVYGLARTFFSVGYDSVSGFNMRKQENSSQIRWKLKTIDGQPEINGNIDLSMNDDYISWVEFKKIGNTLTVSELNTKTTITRNFVGSPEISYVGSVNVDKVYIASNTNNGGFIICDMWDVEYIELDDTGSYVKHVMRIPLCEPIIDPSNHIYHDVSGNGNHATLVNGTMANNGKQDVFHYLQRGSVKRSTGELIPILEDGSGFADGSLLGDVDAIAQDSHSFLNTGENGTELEAYDYPALKQADKDDNFWNEDDGLGTVAPKPVQFDSLITQKGLSDKLFLDSSVSETIKNVRMYGNDLKRQTTQY